MKKFSEFIQERDAALYEDLRNEGWAKKALIGATIAAGGIAGYAGMGHHLNKGKTGAEPATTQTAPAKAKSKLKDVKFVDDDPTPAKANKNAHVFDD